MSKYSDEFKLKVVKYCIDKRVGFLETAKHFNIGKSEVVRRWVKRYEQNGINGLLKNLKSSYSGDFKVNVLEYMYANHLSFNETAFHFNLGNINVIQRWERIYYEEGVQALYEERRGSKKKMSSKSTKNSKKLTVTEKLIEENKLLKMENEYLKKLNALVQERIKRENKKK